MSIWKYQQRQMASKFRGALHDLVSEEWMAWSKLKMQKAAL